MFNALRIGSLAAFLLTAGGTAGAQQLPVEIDVDHASFAFSADTSLVEVYLGVGAASLDFESEGNGFSALLPLDLRILRSATTDLNAAATQAVWADSTVLKFSLRDTSGLGPGQQFVHQVRTIVPPGEYEMRLTVPETDERPELELRRDLLVASFDSGGSPQLSDLTLASEIVQSDDESSPFYKNGLIVRPSANQLFGDGLPRLFYYAEAYGTDALQTGDEYTVYIFIADANGPQPMQDLERRLEREARSPDVVVGSFDTSGLPSGSYFLRMALLNASNEAVVEQARKFFVYNPDVAREQPVTVETAFETSSYAAMSENEVEQGLAHAGLIANESERQRMRQLPDLDSERRFLMEFWRKRDDTPATLVNEVKEDFYRRLQYSNERYSTNVEDGWRSDRGRAVIKYGLPNNIEPHLYDRDAAPHEIWRYHNIPGEGQATFVFADLTGFGSFELLHSSVPGERSLPNWQQELSGR
jgi:GWxTD domain-containing protein